MSAQVAEVSSPTAHAPARTSMFATRAPWLGALVVGAIVPILLVIVWDQAVRVSGTRLIPRPYAVAQMMWDFIVGGVYDDAFSRTFHIHLWESVKRVYIGFFLAAILAVPMGLLIGRVPLMRRLFDPLFALLRPIPVTAWLPLSMIFFGLGPNAAIFLVFVGAFYPILLNTVFGVRSADQRLFEAAAMLGCDGSKLFGAVVLPAALPTIFNGLRIGLSFSWILIVVGEMTGVPNGLGAVIMDGRNLSRTDLVITGMVIIGLAGFLSDRMVVALNNRLLAWSPQHRG